MLWKRLLVEKTISMGSLAHLTGTKRLLAQKIQTLESKFVQLGISESGGLLASVEGTYMFIEEIMSKKFEDGHLDELRKKIAIGNSQGTHLDANSLLNYKGRICVPRVTDFILRLLQMLMARAILFVVCDQYV